MAISPNSKYGIPNGYTYPKFEISKVDSIPSQNLPTIEEEDAEKEVSTNDKIGGPLQRSPNLYFPANKKA